MKVKIFVRFLMKQLFRFLFLTLHRRSVVSNLATSSSESVRADSDVDFLNSLVQRHIQEAENKDEIERNLCPPEQTSQKCLSLESVHEDTKVSVERTFLVQSERFCDILMFVVITNAGLTMTLLKEHTPSLNLC